MAEIPIADFNEAYARRKAGSKRLSKEVIEAVRACSSRAEVRDILANPPKKERVSKAKKVVKSDDKKQ